MSDVWMADLGIDDLGILGIWDLEVEVRSQEFEI